MDKDDNIPQIDSSQLNIEEFLRQEDLKYGKNTGSIIENNLGKSIDSQVNSTISIANDPTWKKIPLENLPSKGLFYADNTEIAIRSATTFEIRHWSTIDEDDQNDVNDQLNFILEKCARIQITKSSIALSWEDILEIDKLYIIFLIHELTFLPGQNELSSSFICSNPSCTNSKTASELLQVNSKMLQIIDIPDEVMEFYSPIYKCFIIRSAKINQTFYLYMPTIGTINRLRSHISLAKSNNMEIDKTFIKISPYLIQDWTKFVYSEYTKLLQDSFNYHPNKLAFLIKFAKLLKDSKSNILVTDCPACHSKMISPIFSRSGFTVQDLFIISGRLTELI